MLLAWGSADIIRYAYFALTLTGFELPALVWLRYSAFYVFYPIGFLSEMVEVYLGITLAWSGGGNLNAVALAIAFLTYIPGKRHSAR